MITSKITGGFGLEISKLLEMNMQRVFMKVCEVVAARFAILECRRGIVFCIAQGWT
jgi:hypothetical protein